MYVKPEPCSIMMRIDAPLYENGLYIKCICHAFGHNPSTQFSNCIIKKKASIQPQTSITRPSVSPYLNS